MNIVDCSRIYDIVATHPSIIVEEFQRGQTWATNQRNHSEHKIISLRDFKLLRLWSKNYGKFIDLEKNNPYFSLMKNVVYVFMMNGVGGREYQPNDIDTDLAIFQIKELLGIIKDPKSIIIDYSPIYSWNSWGEIEYTSVYFEDVIKEISEIGIDKCLYGFLDRSQYYSALDIFGNDMMIAGLSDQVQDMISSLMLGTASKYGVDMYPKSGYEEYSYDIGRHLSELGEKDGK